MYERIRRNTPEFDELRGRAYDLRTQKQMTITQIAGEMNLSFNQVRGLLANDDGILPRKHKYKAVYPQLENWMLSEYGSVAACSRALGWRNTTLDNLIYWGGVFTRKEQIDQLLALSGLTYEAAFKEAEDK